MFSFYLFVSDVFTALTKVFAAMAEFSVLMARRFHNKARTRFYATSQDYSGR